MTLDSATRSAHRLALEASGVSHPATALFTAATIAAAEWMAAAKAVTTKRLDQSNSAIRA